MPAITCETKMNFSYADYRCRLLARKIHTPLFFTPYIQIHRVRYAKQEREFRKKILKGKTDFKRAMEEIGRRVDTAYRDMMQPMQRNVLTYSQRVVPAFKFAIPHVIASDWLAMVGWNKFQRDHLVHQPLTAYVVLKMLTGCGDKPLGVTAGDSLLDVCVDFILSRRKTDYLFQYLHGMGLTDRRDVFLQNNNLSRAFWKKLFVEAAYLAAMFHDIGYPWQYVRKHVDSTEYMTTELGFNDGVDEMLIEHFKTRLVCTALNGYQLFTRGIPVNWHAHLDKIIKTALDKTHGFPGSLYFLFLNDLYRDFPCDTRSTHPIRSFVTELAGTAIATHDLCSLYWGDSSGRVLPEESHFQIDIERDPISMVVTLADQLQEFERVHSAFSAPPSGAASLTFSSTCRESSIDLGKQEIVYRIPNAPDRALKLKYVPQEEKNLFGNNGFMDLSAIGISRMHVRIKP